MGARRRPYVCSDAAGLRPRLAPWRHQAGRGPRKERQRDERWTADTTGILGERKTAKIIDLLEEMRRDNPLVRNRVDDTAAAMAKPADPGAVLSAIEEVHRTIAEERG